MRIISGEAKGQRLKSLTGESTRPSSGRLKEALFSILHQEISDKRVLDLFAGSGQIGLEAISRGASCCVFVERSKNALSVLRSNIAGCGFQSRSRVIPGDAIKTINKLARQAEVFDLIYLDPPWDKAEIILPKLDLILSDIMHESSRVVLELDESQESLVESLSFECYKTCHYGRAMLLFYNMYVQ